jgi:hypothetical protein
MMVLLIPHRHRCLFCLAGAGRRRMIGELIHIVCDRLMFIYPIH